jgi:hypothetical protein
LKLIGLYVVWRLLSVLFGNPWLALAVLALALYALDRRFVVVRILVPVGPTVPANGPNRTGPSRPCGVRRDVPRPAAFPAP